MLRTLVALVALAAAGSAQVTPFGQPCDTTSSFPPSLLAAGPVAFGRDASFAVLAAPSVQPAVLLVGRSNQQWNGGALPLDLGRFGLPGCSLLVAPDVGVPFGASTTLTLPTAGLPAGARFHLQAVCNDTVRNAPAALSGGLEVRVPVPERVLRLAMLPDTQKYTEVAAYFRHFQGQTDLVANQAPRYAFAVQIGDIVQHGGHVGAEWSRAWSATDRLDGVLPWTVCLGNHDYDDVNDKSSAVRFVQWFGPQRFTGYGWFGGATADGRSSWQRITRDGQSWLHFALEWRPRDVVLAWAQEVLARHPGLPAIVSTHEHLGRGQPAPWRGGGSTPADTGDNSGADVFRKLCEPFPQVFLVMCGHVIGYGRRSDTTVFGQDVHQFLADYQGELEGGYGWFRDVAIDERAAAIEVRALSPTWQPGAGPDHRGDPAHEFDLPYDGRSHRARLGSTRVARFREGQRLGRAQPWIGTQDTYVGDGIPNSVRGDDDLVWCDGNQTGGQGLLRFDGIVGGGPQQVPAGATVRRAVLTLTFEGRNAQSTTGSRLHRMLVPWSENDTWQSLGSGVQLGSEARRSWVVDTAGQVDSRGTLSFDVTATLQSWVDGAPNHGWVFLAGGDDGQAFRSSEWAGVAERPLLTVTW